MEQNTPPTRLRLLVTATGHVLNPDTGDYLAGTADQVDVEQLITDYDVVHVEWTTAYDGPRLGNELRERIIAARDAR